MDEDERLRRHIAALEARQAELQIAFAAYSSAQTNASLLGGAGVLLFLANAIWRTGYGVIGVFLAVGAFIYWRMARSDYRRRSYDRLDVEKQLAASRAPMKATRQT